MNMRHDVNDVSDCVAKAAPDATQLTRNISYLLGRARLRLSTLANKKLINELGITNVQASLLFMVSTGEAASMKALAQSSGMDMASTSRMIAMLEARGLITRIRSNSDRRVIGLQLTTAGRALACRFPQILDEIVDSALPSFDDVRKRALRDMLEDLIVSLRDIERKPVPVSSTSTVRPMVNDDWRGAGRFLLAPTSEA